MNTELIMILASSSALQKHICQLYHQAFFHYFSAETPIALEDIQVERFKSQAYLKTILNLLVAFGVMSKNEENEYYSNEFTNAYLEQASSQMLENTASIDMLLSHWKELAPAIETFSLKAQLSLMTCIPLLLNALKREHILQVPSLINWHVLPEEQATLIKTIFIRFSWINSKNPSLLTQLGQETIQAFENLQKTSIAPLLTLFPQLENTVTALSQQIQLSIAEKNARGVVFIVDFYQLSIYNAIKPLLSGMDIELVVADIKSANTDDLLADKAKLHDKNNLIWVVLSSFSDIQQMSHLIKSLLKYLPPLAVESMLMFHDQYDSNRSIYQGCGHLLGYNLSFLNQSFTELLTGYLNHQSLFNSHTHSSLICNYKGFQSTFIPSSHRISTLNKADLDGKDLKHYGLSSRQAYRLIDQYPLWQFKINTSASSAFVLTKLEKQDHQQFIHIFVDKTKVNDDKEQILISFICDMARLSGGIDGVIINGIVKDIKKDSTLCESLQTSVKHDTLSIVGYALQTAGAEDVDAFWQLQQGHQDAIQEYKITDRVPVAKDKASQKVYKGGLLKQPINLFDADFFKISAVEAAYLDPQQRLLLETTWHAIEHSGLTQEQLSQAKTGIFVGASNQDFGKLIAKHGDATGYNRYVNAGGHNATLAGRLAYFLKTNHESVVIDTACASSMTALHHAKISLQRGDIDIAIVAGVNLILSPEFTEGDHALGVISESGQVRSFSDDADGYVRSEAIAVIILTNSDVILEHHLTAHANLLATQVNQESSAKYFSVPGVASQVALMQQALTEAHLKPQDIDVIEAHATGTKGGDAIELNALGKLHGEHQLLLSSSKPIIGHTEAPSGLVGIIKMMMAMKHEMIPAQHHFVGFNQQVETASCLKVIDTPYHWLPKEGRKRIAAVTSLSYSGANAHVILSEPHQYSVVPELVLRKRWEKLGGYWEKFEMPKNISSATLAPLVISAKTSEGLIAQIESYIRFLSKIENENHETWLNLAYSSTMARDHFEHRRIILADGINSALEQLKKDTVDFSQHIGDLPIPDQFTLEDAKTRYQQDLVFKHALEQYWPINQPSLLQIRVEEISEIERLIMHQANQFVYEFIGLDPHQAPINLAMSCVLKDVQTAFQENKAINWSHVWFSQLRQRIQLPSYEFQRQSYWPSVLGGQTQFVETSALSKVRNEDDRQLLLIFNSLTHQNIDSIDVGFFEIGGNSLKVPVLKHLIATRLGVNIELKDLFHYNTVRKLVDSFPQKRQLLQLEQIEPNPSLRYHPFSMTPIQQAYAYGRTLSPQLLGGTSTHLYYEMDWDKLDLAQFQRSFNILIQRHDMLRAIVHSVDQQVVLNNPGCYVIQNHDFSHFDFATFEKEAQNIRLRLSHETFELKKWPLYKVEVIRGRDKDRILFSFDCLFIDMFSLHLLMREWFALYSDSEKVLTPLTLTFRDYVEANSKVADPNYEKAKAYWLAKLPSLAPAPKLPFKNHPSELKSLTFTRVSKTIAASQWKALKIKAAKANLSPTSVLLSLFALVVAKWSSNKSFLLNLTLFTRKSLHEEVNHILGDFTETALLSLDTVPWLNKSFMHIVQAVHDELWKDLEHSAFQGVNVAREIIKKSNLSEDKIVSPIVFTSLLELGDNDQSNTWLSMDKMVYGITQTPQVHLDHKTFEKDGALVAEWDFPEGLFDASLISDMHTCYCELVDAVATLDWQEQCPEVLPQSQQAVIHYAPQKVFPDADKGLHQLFDDARKKYPDHIAVVSEDGQLTYQQLYATAQNIAASLESKVRPNELIAVFCPPGWRQVAACLAIQYAGGAYLPMEGNLPEKYLSDLLRSTGAKVIISCNQFSAKVTDICSGVTIDKLLLDNVVNEVQWHIDRHNQPDNLAYVIFTSGTTSKPKGVKITHRSAVNTVLDINDRFTVTEKDKVFAISKLNFDLSVYDIFGLLAVGGTIIYPDLAYDKDPAHWYELCQRHEVTLWNSVPKIVEMLIIHMSLNLKQALSLPSLRLVMMSGDWIPLQLPEKISRYCPNPNLVRMSLGGATEGAIWSIGREIDNIQATWRSIPYGKALMNQTMMILDEHMQSLPIGVEGDIYIGGVGVAQGYWCDEQKTAEAFKHHPVDGKMVYKTGDRGYKDAAGEIIFCGRVDNQVKINGYRIELEGITACLNKVPGVEDSVILNVTEQGADQLVAFVQRDKSPQFKVLEATFDSSKSAEDKASFKKSSQSVFLEKRLKGAHRIDFKAAQIRTDVWYARKSYRQFDGEKSITMQALHDLLFPASFQACQATAGSLSDFLSVCASVVNEAHALPKYSYPSAGSAYPVKIYLLVGNDDAEIEAGVYYYHAEQQGLYRIGEAALAKGLSIVTVSHDELIKPLYGERGLLFADYENGHISALLSQAANQFHWGFENTSTYRDLHTELKLGEHDRVLSCFSINRHVADFQEQKEAINGLHTYVYIQKSDDLAEGLYEWSQETLLPCAALSHYPIALDHQDDNVSIMANAQAIIVLSSERDDISNVYQNMGQIAQEWMQKAPELEIGLCTMGLPFLPDALTQIIKGKIHMAYAIGHVSRRQLLDKEVSTIKYDIFNKSQYFEDQLKAQQTLPSYAIPRVYFDIPMIPLTGNGKVDRKKLVSIYEEKTKHLASSHAVSTPKTILVKGTMGDIVDVIERTIGKKINITRSWRDNHISSFTAVSLKTVLKEHFGITLTHTQLLQDYSIKECLEKTMTGMGSELTLPQALSTSVTNEPIAIIGMSARFSGAKDLDAYWRLLCDGLDGLTYYPSAQVGQMQCYGAIEGMFDFDSEFFKISPKDGNRMHPGHRVWLESVWHALEDACYAGNREHETIGVFATLGGDPYLHASYYESDGLTTRTLNEHDYIATRTAYAFDFRGPAETIQSACSSSLVAIHRAVTSLRQGEATMMVAGGIHTSRLNQEQAPYYPKGSIFSEQGHCQPYGDRADGIIETQGVGVVVLKPLSRAQSDGDKIYATILGGAVNNDGRHKANYTTPNGDAQKEVILKALQVANVKADSISAVEGHGTGTPIGDPIEFEALKVIYGQNQPVALSSVKGNIGHTVNAAGVAGFERMALSLHYGILPKIMHVNRPNPALGIEKTNFYLTMETKVWDTRNAVRRGGISSFGMGGTNVHMIMEEAPQRKLDDKDILAHQWLGVRECAVPAFKSSDAGPWLFTLSAKTPFALTLQVSRLRQQLAAQPLINLADLAYTLSIGREQMRHRFIVEANDAEHLINLLQNTGDANLRQASQSTAFISWYHADAYFRALVDSCADIFKSINGLGELADAIEKGGENLALTLVFQYSALRRYQSCGLSLMQSEANGSGDLALQVATRSITLDQALNQVNIIGELKISGIDIADGQRGLRDAISNAFKRGLDINWRGYWCGSIRQKISAPLYPFENTLNKAFEEKPEDERRDERFLNDKEMILELDLSEAYLSHHQLMSYPVVPGAAFTGLILNALKTLDDDCAYEIKSLEYIKPLRLNPGERPTFRIQFDKPQGDVLGFKISKVMTDLLQQQEFIYARGMLSIVPNAKQQMPIQVDIEHISKRLTQQKDISSIYANLTQSGVVYGPRFRGIKKLIHHESDNELLAYLSLEASANIGNHCIHPVLLDSAYQALATMLLSKQTIAENNMFVPIGHGHIQFNRALSAGGYAHASIRVNPDDKSVIGKLFIYTEEGHLSMFINDLKLASVPKDMIQNNLDLVSLKDLYYQLEFKNEPKLFDGKIQRHWLVLESPESTGISLKRMLEEKGDFVHLINDSEIDFLSKKVHFNEAIGVIYAEGLRQIETASLVDSAWKLTQFVNKLAQQKIRINRFIVANAHEFDHGIYQGFCSSLAAAKPTWQVSLVDIDNSQRPDIASLLANEARQDHDVELMVYYQKHNRLIGRLKPFTPLIPRRLSSKLFDANEVCLVTGGLGGLGLKVAEWLIDNGAKHLVLLSRQKQQVLPKVIEAWRQHHHVDIVTPIVDVSHGDELAQEMQKIKSRQLKLVGIFHLAGVIRDALIDKLVEQDFKDVFAAKVLGSQNLHDLSIGETHLRYFVLFSSLVSLIGSAGQLNYATANSFLDALSEHRRRNNLPAQRINYGAWAEAGMVAKLSAEQKHSGMDQITIDEGLKAMNVSMLTNNAFTCARVNWPDMVRVRGQFGLIEGLFKPAEEEKRTASSSLIEQLRNISERERLERIKQKLAQHIANAYGAEADLIDRNAGIQEMITESLALRTLATNMGADWGELVQIEDATLLTYPTINVLAQFINQKFQRNAKDDLAQKEVWRRALPSALKCVYHGNLFLAKLIMTNKVDTYVDSEGRTALYVAVAKGDTSMIAWLLQKGADKNAKTHFGISVMDMVAAINIENITIQFSEASQQFRF